MAENNVVKFPLKDFLVKKPTSQVVEKEEILNLDNIDNIKAEEQVAPQAVPEPQFQPFTIEQIDHIKSESYKRASDEVSKKLTDAHIAEKSQLIDSLEKLKSSFEKLEIGKSTFSEELVNVCSNLAVTIAKKIIGESAALHEEKVVAFFRETIPKIINEDCIYVTLNSQIASVLEAKIKEIAKASSFNGEVKVVVNDNFGSGECEVLWGNGSAKYSLDDLMKKIEELFNSNVPSPTSQIDVPKIISEDDLPKAD